MAKNITLWGANYSSVPAILLPQTEGGTVRFTDTSPTTATDADVASGKIYFKSDGSQSTGTSSGGGGGGGIEITQDAQGYIVLPEQGGGSGSGGWTMIHSETFTTSWSDTGSYQIKTIKNLPAIETSKVYYARIRDQAGRRDGYFYGSDGFYLIGTPTAINYGGITTYRRNANGTDGVYRSFSGGSPYGVYVNYLQTSSGVGRAFLQATYSSSGFSGMIDGTYDIAIYESELPTTP